MRLFLQTIKDAFVKAISFDKKMFIGFYKTLVFLLVVFFGVAIGLIWLIWFASCIINGNFVFAIFLTLCFIVLCRFYSIFLALLIERFPKLF